jgi:predicted nuclease of restriction endonuclease-like (RecB) superfamily
VKPNALIPLKQVPQVLLRDIRGMIESARAQVARAANAGLTLLYWSIGKRLREDILRGKRATYRERIVQTLSAQLVVEYGQGFGLRNLFRMIRFAETFPDRSIVSTLSAQLGWSHFVDLIAIEDPLKRDFYAEMSRIEKWNVRTLRAKIGGMLFERTGLSRNPEEVAKMELAKLREEDKLTPDLVFRDPYFLDFLNLQGAYSEKDLESAILRELEQFLVELGTDFTFVARQKRMHLGSKDYHLDLLFFHRRLRALVAIELKLNRFEPADMGQMEFYLRWLEKYEKRPGENSPIGLILCASKNHEDVELVRLSRHGIQISEYITQLPPRHLLEKKLHEAVRLARERIQ